jgi:hypothetical protein
MAHVSRFGLRNSVAAGFAVAAIAAGAAQAQALPDPSDPPTYPGSYFSIPPGVTYITGPGLTTANYTDQYGATTNVSVSVALTPHPSIHANASFSVPDVYGAMAGGQVSVDVQYLFLITDNSDPSSQVLTQVTVNGEGGFTYTNVEPSYDQILRTLQSSFGVAGVLHDYVLGNADGGALAPGPTSSSDNSTYNMYTNEYYVVDMVVGFNGGLSGNGYPFGGGTETMSAYVDPTFTLADPSLYSIHFSLGVGNATAAPEPSTWAMMLIGFAGLGFGARKRIAAASVAQTARHAVSRNEGRVNRQPSIVPY